MLALEAFQSRGSTVHLIVDPLVSPTEIGLARPGTPAACIAKLLPPPALDLLFVEDGQQLWI